MRFPRIKAEGQSFYHCVSRVVDRQFIFQTAGHGSPEAERFVLLMRRLEAFSGVRVLTYSLMSISELFWASQMPSAGKKSASSIASTSLCTEACTPKPSSPPLTWPPLKVSLTSKTANSPCPNAYGAAFASSPMASSWEVSPLWKPTSSSSTTSSVTNVGALPRA